MALIETAPLTDAVIAVAERSFFAWAEPAADGPMATDGVWHHASVAFDGDFRGRTTFSVPPSLADELFRCFLGLGPDDPVDEAALRDLLGEFANMSCGSWLTGVQGRRCFTLASPEVESSGGTPSGEPTAVVMVNDQPVLIGVTLEGAAR
ncbi:MAG TPA: chemotaxis protein CheX [Luteitalea sp.]|nr:chemotaxis protein CheX [Luteitalea sp.]